MNQIGQVNDEGIGGILQEREKRRQIAVCFHVGSRDFDLSVLEVGVENSLIVGHIGNPVNVLDEADVGVERFHKVDVIGNAIGVDRNGEQAVSVYR